MINHNENHMQHIDSNLLIKLEQENELSFAKGCKNGLLLVTPFWILILTLYFNL